MKIAESMEAIMTESNEHDKWNRWWYKLFNWVQAWTMEDYRPDMLAQNHQPAQNKIHNHIKTVQSNLLLNEGT